jgi:hypothetical protein
MRKENTTNKRGLERKIERKKSSEREREREPERGKERFHGKKDRARHRAIGPSGPGLANNGPTMFTSGGLLLIHS